MLIGLHHVGRTVHDVDTVAGDHAAITGWPVTEYAAGSSPLCVGRDVGPSVLLHGPNAWVELVSGSSGAPARRGVNVPGIAHCSIQTGDTSRCDARMEEREIERHAGPVELGTGFTYLYVRDCEHDVIEIEGAPHAPRHLDPWLSHGAIVSCDLERLSSAYGELLGSEPTPRVRLHRHAEFDRGTGLDGADALVTFVRAPNGSVEFWQYDAPVADAPPVRDIETVGAGHLAFETSSLRETVDCAVGAGFEVVDPEVVVDGLRIVRLADPDRNCVELVQFDDLDDPLSLRTRPDLRRPAKMDALLAGLG